MVLSLVDINLDSSSNFLPGSKPSLNSSCISRNLNLLQNFQIWVVPFGEGIISPINECKVFP